MSIQRVDVATARSNRRRRGDLRPRSHPTDPFSDLYTAGKHFLGDCTLALANLGVRAVYRNQTLEGVQAQKEAWMASWTPETGLDLRHFHQMEPFKLQKPLLIVPGWKTSRDRFNPAAAALAGQDSQPIFVKAGAFYQDSEATQPLPPVQVGPDQKVFVMVHDYAGNSAHQIADQMEACVATISSRTGVDSADIHTAGYSNGGKGIAEYVSRGNSVASFFSLAVPHSGSAQASGLYRAIEAEDRGYPTGTLLRLAQVDSRDYEALDDLRPEGELTQRHRREWPELEGRMGVATFVGTGAKPTMKEGESWFARIAMEVSSPSQPGDGRVTIESAAPSGEKLQLVSDGDLTDHDTLPFNGEVWDVHFRQHAQRAGLI